MSYVATTSTLDIGDSTSTTVNINSANTLNLGKNTGSVNIRGLDLLISSTTSNFASFTPNSGDGTGSARQCFYLLPFSTTQNLLVQWGFVPDITTSTITFNLPYRYDSVPYLYATKYSNGSQNNPLSIQSVGAFNFTIDSSQGSSDEASFCWLAIGLRDK